MALIGSLGTGVSAMKSFVKGLEVVGNNIANVNTTGFKGQRVNYNDSFSLTLSQADSGQAGGSNSNPVQIGTGVGIGSTQRNFDQGAASQTGIATDLAIMGNGFFQVQDENGANFATRDGAFRLNQDGFLVTQGGMFLQGFGAERDATTNEASLTSSVGSIRIDNAGDAENRQVDAWNIDTFGRLNIFLSDGTSFTGGQILLRDFASPGALTAMGNGLFSGFEAAGPKTAQPVAANQNGLGAIQSRALEGSNVDLTEEFANMITAQRAFQAGSRLISVSDEVLQEMVNLKR